MPYQDNDGVMASMTCNVTLLSFECTGYAQFIYSVVQGGRALIGLKPFLLATFQLHKTASNIVAIYGEVLSPSESIRMLYYQGSKKTGFNPKETYPGRREEGQNFFITKNPKMQAMYTQIDIPPAM
jgi:hypothetical protein